MKTDKAICKRILGLLGALDMTINDLALASSLPDLLIKGILNGTFRSVGILTIKSICDGFGITLGEFFSTPEFDALEQEIK